MAKTRVKRKYTYHSEETKAAAQARGRQNKSLREYKHAIKKAKQFSKANSQISKEYEEYVKEYYKISKEYRESGVKISKGHKQGLFKAGKYYEGWERSEIKSISDFKRYMGKYEGLTGKQFAESQYNLLSEDIAKELQAKLSEEGLGEYSIEVIRARQLPQSVWNKMQEIADKEGQTISEYFFGSY